MLQVTDAAVSVLKSEVLHEGEPSEGMSATAIRIRSVATDDGRQNVTLQPVMGPEPGDAAAEATDLDVFVASELAGPLDSSVLDAQVTPEGPEILLREQPQQN
jgi:Fe-S cluster assembly iron-binding protein IscA